MNEEMKAFIELVKLMRDNQKNYFKTRKAFYLQESKRLESQVDTIIKQLASPSLFDQKDL